MGLLSVMVGSLSRERGCDMVFSFKDFLALVYYHQAKNYEYVGLCSYNGRAICEVCCLVDDSTIYVDCSDAEMASVLGPSIFGP